MIAHPEQNLADAFAELLEGVVSGTHVSDTLALLTRRCVDLLEISAAGIIVTGLRGGLRVLAASDEPAGLTELFQTNEDEGPSIDVISGGGTLIVDLTDADGRWPAFAPAARAVGFSSVRALPIRLDGETIGALNLFRRRPDPSVDSGRSAEQALADLVSVVLSQERPERRAEQLAEHVQGVLNNRGGIEQAKGALAARLGGDPARAHTVLLHVADSRGVPVVVIAHGVLAADPETLARCAEAWARLFPVGTADE